MSPFASPLAESAPFRVWDNVALRQLHRLRHVLLAVKAADCVVSISVSRP